jgi:hypothetical protein
MIIADSYDFERIYKTFAKELSQAPLVDVGEWQSLHGDIPQAKTREVTDAIFTWLLPNLITGLQNQVKPNLPWAEDHFLERVSGVPYNPPPSHEWWPFAQKSNDQHRKQEKFSHTYPERFWPKQAGNFAFHYPLGIRYSYGDLNDVVRLLRESPHTRQAYLPVWFPEDTGAVHGERVPCSLGYHFLLRDNHLSCRYFIRSCDFLRHFRDDVYMAGRLTQWIANELDESVGNLTMVIGSLHVFDGEHNLLTYDDDEPVFAAI